MSTPKLRFKEFGGSWESKKIGSFLKIKSGLGFKANEYTLNEEVPLLQIENIGYGRIKWTSNIKYVPNNYLNIHKDLVLIQNDIVLALNRPVTNDQLKIAKVSHSDKNSILYQRVGKLIFHNNINNHDFIFQIFQRDIKNYVLNNSIGSDQPFISTTDLYRYSLNLPPINEQTKIANFLTTVDEKINQLNQKQELLTQYKKGMMQKLFSQQIRFKADDGSEFGEWIHVAFEEIGTFLKGKGISKADVTKDGLIPCIRYGELYTHYGAVISKVISATNLESQNLFLSKANDILIPASGETQTDIATASCVLDNNIALSGDLNIFRTKENGIFLSYLIRSYLKTQIAQLAQGNAVVHLYSKQLKTVKVNLPSLPEQAKIANFLSSIDQKIDLTTQQLEQAKQWKKGLLQQMFV